MTQTLDRSDATTGPVTVGIGALTPADVVAVARHDAAVVLDDEALAEIARTRAVFSSWPVARWKRRLNCSFFSLSTSSSS